MLTRRSTGKSARLKFLSFLDGELLSARFPASLEILFYFASFCNNVHQVRVNLFEFNEAHTEL